MGSYQSDSLKLENTNVVHVLYVIPHAPGRVQPCVMGVVDVVSYMVHL